MNWSRSSSMDSRPGSPSRESLLPLPVTSSQPSASSSSSTHPRPPPPRSTLERLAAKGKGKSHNRSMSDGRRDHISSAEEEGRLGADDDEDESRPMKFGVRFTDGSLEDVVPLWVGVDETVRDVQRRIRVLRPSLIVDGKPRRLRLIQLGRLLTDGTKLVPYARSLLSRRAKLVAAQLEPTLPLLGEIVTGGPTAREKEKQREKELRAEKGKGHERRASVGSDKGKEREREDEDEEDETVWLHCSVGEPMDEPELQGEKVQTTQITPLQGFDRLRDAGFSEAEITSMRQEFRASTGQTALVDGDADADEHARALEDQWMEGLTGQNEAQAETTTGVYTTLLQGVCVGFFLPFLPFFFFRTQIFSTRWQMAIVLGAACNLLFGLLRAFG